MSVDPLSIFEGDAETERKKEADEDVCYAKETQIKRPLCVRE